MKSPDLNNLLFVLTKAKERIIGNGMNDNEIDHDIVFMINEAIREIKDYKIKKYENEI